MAEMGNPEHRDFLVHLASLHQRAHRRQYRLVGRAREDRREKKDMLGHQVMLAKEGRLEVLEGTGRLETLGHLDLLEELAKAVPKDQ